MATSLSWGQTRVTNLMVVLNSVIIVCFPLFIRCCRGSTKTQITPFWFLMNQYMHYQLRQHVDGRILSVMLALAEDLSFVSFPESSFFLVCAVMTIDDEPELLVDTFCVNKHYKWLHSRHLVGAHYFCSRMRIPPYFCFPFLQVVFCWHLVEFLFVLRSDDDWWRGWAACWYVLCQQAFLVITIEAFVWALFFCGHMRIHITN